MKPPVTLPVCASAGTGASAKAANTPKLGTRHRIRKTTFVGEPYHRAGGGHVYRRSSNAPRVSRQPSLDSPLERIVLSAGQLMTLDCAVHHDVEALEESAFLLSIAWWKGESRPTEKQATHSLSAELEHRLAIESHELKPHIGKVDDRPQTGNCSDRSREKFACEHQLPPR